MPKMKKQVDIKKLDWFTLQQAGEVLQLSAKTVGRRCEDGSISAEKFGVKWRIPRSSLYKMWQAG